MSFRDRVRDACGADQIANTHDKAASPSTAADKQLQIQANALAESLQALCLSRYAAENPATRIADPSSPTPTITGKFTHLHAACISAVYCVVHELPRLLLLRHAVLDFD